MSQKLKLFAEGNLKREEKRKKSNEKGFTLIELLAVITIMGILLFVGVLAISKIIFNSRKDSVEVSMKRYENEANVEIKSHEIGEGIVGDGTYSIMKNGISV